MSSSTSGHTQARQRPGGRSQRGAQDSTESGRAPILGSVPSYLRIDPGQDPVSGRPSGPSYTLSSEFDLERYVDEIAAALANGHGLTLPLAPLEGSAETRAYVIINGSLVRQVLIGEAPDGEPEPQSP